MCGTVSLRVNDYTVEKKPNTKLNLTKDFCNNHKDLCNVFLKLKWTIKSIGEKKGENQSLLLDCWV